MRRRRTFETRRLPIFFLFIIALYGAGTIVLIRPPEIKDNRPPTSRRTVRQPPLGMDSNSLQGPLSKHFTSPSNETSSPKESTADDTNLTTVNADLESYVKNTLISVGMNASDIPADYTGYLEPFWKCAKNVGDSSHRKLVFLHIFKTAGSSFRRFFGIFGFTCCRGTAIVAQCSEISTKSMMESPQSRWRSSNGKQQCTSTFSIDRSGQKIHHRGVINEDFLQQHIDLIAGHLQIGIHDYWRTKQGSNETVDAQYIAFFREPVAKFVSGQLYLKRDTNWTSEEAAASIKANVNEALSHDDHYNKYKSYLLTPQQKEQSPLAGTYEGVVELIKSNLVQMNVLVGIIERMGDSLALIQSIVDADNELATEFQKLDMSNATAGHDEEANPSSNEKIVANKSKLSTSKIVKMLEKDNAFYPSLQGYLKYEFQVYDYALKLHARQVERLHAGTSKNSS